MRIASVAIFLGAIDVTPARAEVPLDIEQVIASAPAHHPDAREQRATVHAAEAKVDVERARYLPDVEVFAQLDRSTANTSAGVLYPEPGIPVVSGAPRRSLGPGAFGTAAGATVSWDLLGFRRWDAQIDAADRDARAARAEATLTDLDRAFGAGERFIVAIECGKGVEAAHAGVERAQIFVTVVKAAVDQNLRPGADLSRARAELSLAETALIRAESAAQVSVAQLAEALGGSTTVPVLAPGHLLEAAPRIAAAGADPRDPRIAAAAARVDAATARRAAIETTTQPRVAATGAVWARGGDDPGGAAAHGLVPDVPNWSLGVVLTWPVLARASIAPQLRVEAANVERAEAHVATVTEHLQSQHAQAAAVLEAAYRIADATPTTLAAAREAEQQATARYQAKLASADDVAQAQRLLEQAEVDDAVARLDVWRAILTYAYARGDLSIFLAAYRGAGP